MYAREEMCACGVVRSDTKNANYYRTLLCVTCHSIAPSNSAHYTFRTDSPVRISRQWKNWSLRDRWRATGRRYECRSERDKCKCEPNNNNNKKTLIAFRQFIYLFICSIFISFCRVVFLLPYLRAHAGTTATEEDWRQDDNNNRITTAAPLHICQLPISENKMWRTLPATVFDGHGTHSEGTQRERERMGARESDGQEYKVYPRQLGNTWQFIIT